MQWIALIFILALVVFLLPRLSWIPVDQAAERLKAGAALVDVRSPGEFASQRIPGAINIPMGFVAADLQKEGLEPDRQILLHCASGARSAAAMKELQRMGYKQVWNVGSFSRAKKVEQATKANR
ncbi:rhodanese-like domain-containing protein [Puniceicoccales bacterium CK1056]|uniref:Rhodanese-like domain-containing protein n=1 Tax=Oceanipulchritudo coccoides TaxID=2706888 RepID=A0A6B2LZF6_9BACT|nr:rhodanese-like domain-containing protein [Oceanipulchritudo coccoides]NDV61429.1 rhodanese-like domain-containing protein [Oceanipulchritudo coccoides]